MLPRIGRGKCSAAVLFTLLVAQILSAADDEPLSADQQQQLAQTFEPLVQRFEMWTDDQGNVTGLILINHQALTAAVGERPGITDEQLKSLTRLPKLTAINLEAQPVTDDGLQVIRRLQGLKQVGFHYMGKARGAQVSPSFITVIDQQLDLEILEIKHNFRMQEIQVERLRGPFAKVWRLVLDTPIRADQTLHLLSLCPNVTDLQLHRTDLSAEQLAEVGRLAPNIEVLWFKPRGPLTTEHLSALQQFPRLRIFSPQSKTPLPYEGGWDQLKTLPCLERIEIAESHQGDNRAALEQLRRMRPGLSISNALTRSRNYQGL